MEHSTQWQSNVVQRYSKSSFSRGGIQIVLKEPNHFRVSISYFSCCHDKIPDKQRKGGRVCLGFMVHLGGGGRVTGDEPARRSSATVRKRRSDRKRGQAESPRRPSSLLTTAFQNCLRPECPNTRASGEPRIVGKECDGRPLTWETRLSTALCSSVSFRCVRLGNQEQIPARCAPVLTLPRYATDGSYGESQGGGGCSRLNHAWASRTFTSVASPPPAPYFFVVFPITQSEGLSISVFLASTVSDSRKPPTSSSVVFLHTCTSLCPFISIFLYGNT